MTWPWSHQSELIISFLFLLLKSTPHLLLFMPCCDILNFSCLFMCQGLVHVFCSMSTKILLFILKKERILYQIASWGQIVQIWLMLVPATSRNIAAHSYESQSGYHGREEESAWSLRKAESLARHACLLASHQHHSSVHRPLFFFVICAVSPPHLMFIGIFPHL